MTDRDYAIKSMKEITFQMASHAQDYLEVTIERHYTDIKELMASYQKLILGIGRTSFYKMKKQALGYLGFYFYEIVVPQAKDKRFKPSLGVEEEQVSNMRYEDSMKGIADQIIKEQQRVSKIKNNPEEFHWHDEYATLNFFRFLCKNIGNLRNGEIEKMVTRLKNIDQKAVENHVNGAVWAFDYDKMFCVLMENEICRKVCEKNKYNSWMNLIGQYCVSRT